LLVLESLDLGGMLLWKVGTGSCEASRASEMRGKGGGWFLESFKLPIKKKRAVLFTGRLKS